MPQRRFYTMNNCILPVGDAPQPVVFDYFPTRWQHFIWRNWNLVPVKTLADILGTTVQTVENEAAEMGLKCGTPPDPRWLTNGYLTILRNNWHILNYPQLLQLTGLSSGKLKTILEEEDFFYIKLGSHKPAAEPLKYAPLTESERERTKEIKQLVQNTFPTGFPARQEQAFSFLDFKVPDDKSAPAGGDFDLAMIHAYSASCGDLFLDITTHDPLPENLLACYRKLGINAVWAHALLHKFSPIAGAEEFSAGYQERRKNLKILVKRCEKYGIKLFLYFNEPRGINNAFFEKKPSWAGIDVPQLETKDVCTTATSEPLEWLEKGTEQLFAEAPGLGGILLITMSENPTNCHCRMKSRECPSCRNVAPAKIIADVVNAIYRGMSKSSDNARLLAYDWAWQRHEDDEDCISFRKEVIDLLLPGIELCSVSENTLETNIGGVFQRIRDYSISQPGPAETAKAVWQYAQSKNINCTAKIQANNSWELSAVPFIPVPYLVKEHLDNLKACGIKNLMLSWTLGGYPGDNLRLVNSTPEELALEYFNADAAKKVCEAWKCFSEAFRKFPFYIEVIYTAPVNFGPQNIFYPEKTGRKATMIGFPYDDLDSWRTVYPEDVFEHQFELLCQKWQQGMDIIESAKELISPSEKSAFDTQVRMAAASLCHFKSTLFQTSFVRARNAGNRKIMADSICKELKNTLDLIEAVKYDSRIGYEASNHYYYTINDLVEKVINCNHMLKKLK